MFVARCFLAEFSLPLSQPAPITFALHISLQHTRSFYRAALHARGLSYEHLSVRLSVRLSNACIVKTKQISADILIPYERSIHLVFRHEE